MIRSMSLCFEAKNVLVMKGNMFCVGLSFYFNVSIGTLTKTKKKKYLDIKTQNLLLT